MQKVYSKFMQSGNAILLNSQEINVFKPFNLTFESEYSISLGCDLAN